ncbi:MAG: signal peptidase II [Chloroflexi bacterium]|nr:signal peptidase II [Chloroflexota bacterium]MDA1147977.1 signal peptidase II [Chloroflexota bacterium]
MNQAIEERTQPAISKHSRGLTDRLAPLLLVAAVVFAIDQVTKALIRGWLAEGERWPSDFTLLQISHVENSGAAFGMLQGAGPLLIVTTSAAIALIALTMLRAESYPRSHLYMLAMILGGAIGNLTDRIARGSVTDFIDPTHYPSFNIADSAIVIGVSALLLLTLFEDTDDEDAPAQPAGAESDVAQTSAPSEGGAE